MEDDTIWTAIRQEVQQEAAKDTAMASFLYGSVLHHARLEDVVCHLLSGRLHCQTMEAGILRDLFAEAMDAEAAIGLSLRADLKAVRDRDPAVGAYSVPLLYLKGFHALQTHRIAHWFWAQGRTSLAYFLQSRMSTVLGVDIHPAARIGKGIMFDHATGLVIGETAVVGDNVSILHEVTLGGTGKTTGDRHPKVRDWVMIGAGAKILGNVVIGEGAKVGSGSVVLQDVSAHCTVVGVPARVVGRPESDRPAAEMDQSVNI